MRTFRRLDSPRLSAILALLFIVLAPTGCRGGGSQDLDAVKARIALEVEAFNARDMKALSQIWSQASDISLFDVSPPGRFQGWQSIARTFNEFFSRLSEVRLVIDHLEVRVDGTVAYATYDWAITGTMGEAKLDDRGQATAVYRKEKDGWKMVHAHYSVAPASPAAGEPKASGPQPDSPAPQGG